MTTYTAAVLHFPFRQLDPADVRGSQRRNAERVVAALEDVLRQAPDTKLFALPVLALTTPYRNMSGIPIEAIAVELPGEAVFGPIMDFCARHGVWAATSTQETVPAFPGRFFHTGVIFGPEGLTLRSPKAQAYSVPSVTSLRDIKADYEAIYGPDSVLPVADTPIGRLGILVENEGVVPEAARLLARKGAQVILNPTIVRRDGPPMRAIGQTHAFCTGVWWLTASASRVAEPTIPQAAVAFDGESFIAAPGGQVIADCGPEDGFTTATIELHRVAESQQAHARETTPAGILYEDLYRSFR